MDELFIATSLGRVYGRASGDSSDTLVLGIHGWSQRNGWHTWQPMMEPLAGAGFYVVSVDMPGWGKSLQPEAEPLVGKRAVDAAAEILDGLNAASAVLMGKSWGGGVALALALAAPHRVKKLILTAPAYRSFDKLQDLVQPVLLAWSQDDPVIPFEYAAQFTGSIPNVQLETYASGGHSAAQKNVDDFAPKAIKFLRK